MSDTGEYLISLGDSRIIWYDFYVVSKFQCVKKAQMDCGMSEILKWEIIDQTGQKIPYPSLYSSLSA